MDLSKLEQLVNIDSPSGFTQKAIQYCKEVLEGYGWKPEITNKGALRCHLGSSPTLSIAAHVDTLGGVVAFIKSDGTLRLSKVGGPSLPAYEGSYCRVYTLDNKVYTGTFLLDNPAIHVNAELGTSKRQESNMHIRLDELVETAGDIQKLGIQIGDFICFETHYTQTESGYIKSKYMDNKAGCMVLFDIARRVAEAGKEVPVELFFSNYEEVGHGGTVGYADTIQELLVIDMGVVGDDRAGKEHKCSVCAKDSSGPYDYGMRKKLVELATQNNIPYALDIYPYYGSDGSAALRAGNNFRVALIGPGVSASHGIERTHADGIQATSDLSMAYIEHLFE